MSELQRLRNVRDQRAQRLDEAKKDVGETTKGKSETESHEIWQEAYQTELFIYYDELDQAESNLCLHEAKSFYLPIPEDEAAWEYSMVTSSRHLTTSARYALQRQILLERDRESANRSRNKSYWVSVISAAIAFLSAIISVIA